MAKKPVFIIGASGWSYPDWRGIFYPKELPQKYWFQYYSSQFSAVELNATFYRFFPKKIYKKWRDQAPTGFQYIVKVHRLITHTKYLIDCRSLIKKFCRNAATLEDKLGLILLQLPPNMPYDLDRLKKTLSTFDDPTKIVVEFRHPKWFTEDTKKLLTEFNCVFCCADSPKIKLLDWVTSDKAYIRLHGSKEWYDYDYSKRELKKIADFAKLVTKKGAKTVYIFFNNDYEAYAIDNALYLRELLT